MNWLLILSIITTIIIVVYLAKVFVKRDCDHHFKADEVQDLNTDPKCTRCNKYYSAIARTQRVKFEPVNDKEYKLINR